MKPPIPDPREPPRPLPSNREVWQWVKAHPFKVLLFLALVFAAGYVTEYLKAAGWLPR